jgi:hypothetical protein
VPPEAQRAAEAAAGVPRTLGRVALLAAHLLAADRERYPGLQQQQQRPSQPHTAATQAQGATVLPATSTATTTMAAAANSAAPRRPADLRARRAKKAWWGGYLPLAFLLAVVARLGPAQQAQTVAALLRPESQGGGGLLRATAEAMAAVLHRPPNRRCVALDKALGPVARQRLSDLILLSCLPLPSPPTSIQAGVALGSAPLLLPPPVAPTAPTSTAAAFAWADAVLFLHGRAAAVA